MNRFDERCRGCSHRDPRTVRADVEVDEHVELDTRGCRRIVEIAHVLRLVDHDGEARAFLRELYHAIVFVLRHHGRRDEDVFESRVEHDFRFAHFGGTNTDRAAVELLLRENGTLVRLGVRAELRRLVAIKTRHLVEVVVESLLVDDEGGRG